LVTPSVRKIALEMRLPGAEAPPGLQRFLGDPAQEPRLQEGVFHGRDVHPAARLAQEARLEVLIGFLDAGQRGDFVLGRRIGFVEGAQNRQRLGPQGTEHLLGDRIPFRWRGESGWKCAAPPRDAARRG
jgi:hypothetical protein